MKVTNKAIASHFAKAKACHPEFLLIYRNGEQCTCYGTDAAIVSRMFNVPLGDMPTSCDGESLQWAELPGALERCLRRLISAGHRAAICEPVTVNS